MNFGIFAVMYVAGAAALAFWIYVRTGRWEPRDMRKVFLHLAAGMVACQAAAPLVTSLLAGTGITALRIFSVVGIALPALAYGILTMIWAIRWAQSALGGMLR